MPTVNIPNIGAVNFPDGMSQEDIVNAIQNDILPKTQAQAQAPQAKPENVGFIEAIPAALKRGFESLGDVGSGLGLAATSAFGTREETKAKMEAIKADQAKPQEKPAMTVEDFQRIAKEKGFAAAAAEAPKYIVEQVLQSAPQMAGPLAVGATVGAMSGPAGVITGPLAGMGAYAVQQFGNFLVRQAQEKNDPEELDKTKAAITAAGTAPIGYFADRFTLGLGSAGKTAGKEILTELAARRAAGEIGAGAVAKEVGKRVGVGAVEGIIAEAPTEVLEQAAERYQAGLALTGDDAMREYKEAFFGAAAAGGGLGGGAKGVSAYGDYRGELKGITPPEQEFEKVKPIRNAIQEALDYENTGAVPGAGQPGVSVPGTDGGADTGLAGTTPGSVGGAGVPLGGTDVGERTLDDQLGELRAKQEQYAKFDPADPRISEIEDVIKELRADRKATALNAPGVKVPNGPQLVKNGNKLDLVQDGSVLQSFEAIPRKLWDAFSGRDAQEGLWKQANKEVVQEAQNALDVTYTKWQETQPLNRIEQAYIKNKETFNRLVKKVTEGTATKEEIGEYNEAEGFLMRYQLDAVRPSLTKAQALNAPTQGGFDFGAEEPGAQPERIIKSEPTEFALTAPEGKVAEGEGIEATPEPEKAKMMLIGDKTNPMKPVNSFFNSLKSATANPVESTKFRAEVKNLLNDVAEFIGGRTTKEVSRFKEPGAPTPVPEKGPDVTVPMTGPELDKRLGFLNNFFDSLSIAPKEKEALTSALSQRFAGMDAAMQTKALSDLTSVPNLNTRKGVEALRKSFNEALSKFERKELGAEETALPYKLTDQLANMDPYVAAAVSRALRALENIPANERTPEEKAAYAYFGAEGGWSYSLAMRSAAFDLGAKHDNFAGVVFKNQNKQQADLFKKWVEENLPNQEAKRFDASVKFYERMVKKAEEYVDVADKIKKEGGIGQTYSISMGRNPTGKVFMGGVLAGLGKFMAPSKTEFLDPTKFYPMHPAVQERLEAGDVKGALRLLAKAPDKSANKQVKFMSKLAQRLLDLNLNTTISVNQQESIVQSLINYNVSEQRAEFFDYMRVNYPELHKQHFSNDADVRSILEGLNKAKEQADIKPLYGQFEELVDEYSRAVDTLDAGGSYLPYIDTINLNPEKGGFSNYTFLHEMSHAATAYSLDPRNYDKLTALQKGAVNELRALYEFTKRSGIKDYAFTSIDEFVAEAFSNENFQHLLRTIPYKGTKEYFAAMKELKEFKRQGELEFGGKKTLWDAFTDFVFKLFGMNNVLGYTLANANSIMQAPPALTKEQAALNARGRKSRSVLSGTMPTNPGFMSFNEKVFGGRPEWGAIKDNMATLIENVKDTTRQYYLGGFTLRQLNDMIGHRIPQFRTFINKVEGMLDERNRILEEVRKITDRWMRFKDSDPSKATMLDRLMIDTTLAGRDPSKGKTGNADIDSAWTKIGTEGQRIYNEVKDFYARSLQNYIDNIVENKKGQYRTTNDTTSPIYAQETKDLEDNPEVKKVREYFAKHKMEVYFPIRRFGRFSLQLLDNRSKNKEFYLFENASERNAYIRKRVPELEREIGRKLSADEITPRNNLEKLISDNIKDFTFLKEIKDIVRSGKGETNEALKNNLEESLDQLYFLTLPDQSVRKMFMPRKGTYGMSEDMLRAFTSSSFHMAYQHSRYKFSRGLYEDIDIARRDVRSKGEEGKVEAEYLNELGQRLGYIMNPTDTGTIPSFLSNVSFLWFMTSPASAIVNMLGVPAVGMPVLSAKFGAKDTTLKVFEYTKKFTKTGFKDKEGNPAFPSLNNKTDSFDPLQQRAYNQFVADGLIDITLSHDLAGMAEAPSNLYTGKTHTAMKWLSGLFHGAEKFNREIIAMSAFDLAYTQAKKDRYSDEAAYKKAVDIAKDLTYKSMFDYSTLNKPRYFQQPAAKVILQFKQFSQQMTYLLARSAYEWIGKKYSPEELTDIRNRIKYDHINNKPGEPALTDKELNAATAQYINDVKTEARDRLAGTLGMTAVFAGASGLPLWWAVAGVMNAMHTAFGEDDEEWDFDNWFKNWCNKTFGGFVGDSISRGVASQVLGADIAGRLGLNDMWYRDSRKSTDEVTAVQNMMINLLGPTAGLAINSAEALKQFNDGHIQRALETASPAVIKNVLKGLRLGTEGRATTISGNELIGDITAKEAFGQALGFGPERLAQRQKANIEMKTAEQNILNRRQALLDSFFMAFDNDDDDMMDRVLEKVSKFNGTYGEIAITPDKLQKSVKTRYKQRAMAEMTGGMPINKKLIGTLEDMGDYGEPD